MSGEAGLRKTAWVGRDVGRVVVYLVPPIAERVEQGPTMCEHEVSVRKKKLGECCSSIVMMSFREGLLPPAFCALIVRIVNPMAIDGGSGVWSEVVACSA